MSLKLLGNTFVTKIRKLSLSDIVIKTFGMTPCQGYVEISEDVIQTFGMTPCQGYVDIFEDVYKTFGMTSVSRIRRHI